MRPGFLFLLFLPMGHLTWLYPSNESHCCFEGSPLCTIGSGFSSSLYSFITSGLWLIQSLLLQRIPALSWMASLQTAPTFANGPFIRLSSCSEIGQCLGLTICFREHFCRFFRFFPLFPTSRPRVSSPIFPWMKNYSLVTSFYYHFVTS